MVSFRVGQAVGYSYLPQSRLSGSTLAGQAAMEAVRGADGGAVCCFSFSMERKVFLHVLDVGIGDKRGAGEAPLALAVLALEQVPGALLPAQNLTGSCHLESLGNSLSSLCFS